MRGWDVIVERVSTVFVAVAAVVLIWAVLGREQPTSNAGPPVERFEDGEVVASPATAGVRGDDGAMIAIVEFSDFECPYCARHAQDVYPRLMENFVEAGRIRYIFRHFPIERIHPLAFQAAEAVECAGNDGRFWEMHDRLFEADADLSWAGLSQAAESLEIDAAAFEACMNDGSKAQRVLEDMRHAEHLGVSSTPTFLFARIQADGSLKLLARMEGTGTYEAFESTLEDLLADAVE